MLKIELRKILRKIICMVLILIMLTNDMIPVLTLFVHANEEVIGLEDSINAEYDSKGDSLSDENPNENLGMELENDEEKNTLKYKIHDEILEIKTKTDNEEYEIKPDYFKTQFLTGAEKNSDNHLVWTPGNSNSGHEFTFRTNFSVSGKHSINEEALKIYIPKSILRNRSKALDDTYEMSVPHKNDYDGTTELAYYEDGEYLVIYNAQVLSAGLNGFFEITYKTKSSTFNYKDYDKTNTDLVKNGGTASDPYYSIIVLDTGIDKLVNITDETSLFIDTTAKISGTQKNYPTLYRDWNNSWMSTIPDDKDEYYYLVWEIASSFGNNTQPYDFFLEDTIESLNDYEFVGYKLAGEQYFSEKNKQLNQTAVNTRYDYVLTKHKKSSFSGKNYELKNSVIAKVHPVDEIEPDTTANSSNIFKWNTTFIPPTGSFNFSKSGNSSWTSNGETYYNYSSYDLQDLQLGYVNKLKGFKYSINTNGFAFPWTLEEGASNTDVDKYGKRDVTYTVTDDSLYLEDDAKPMSSGDYYIDSLNYSISCTDVEFDDFYQKFTNKETEYNENDIITFYGKFGVSPAWIEIGTYNLKTKEIVFADTYVKEMTAEKIIFNEGVNCIGWQYTTTNKHYSTGINVVPEYVLENSSYVAQKIKDKERIKIKNVANIIVEDSKHKVIYEDKKEAYDYARKTYYDSKITKNITTVQNSVKNRKYFMNWKINVWEKALSGTGSEEYIRQNNGTFYDLIPIGSLINLDSIQLENENGIISKNGYECEVLDNYKNSGRQLLIIKIKESGAYYNLYYRTVHRWDAIADFGRSVLNPIAYETGNEKIFGGFEDDGGNISDENKNLLSKLNENSSGRKFLYAEQTGNINAIMSAVSGLYKKVKNTKSDDYVYDADVNPGEKYSYQLRYQNSFVNKSKDLVFYDSLENYKVEGTLSGGWKGTLKSVDVTQLKMMGIKPVIYVSKNENLDLEKDSNKNLKDSSIWMPVSEDYDFSTVKAIAIEMTKKEDGSDFILDAGKSINATLFLDAPSEETESLKQNPYAYNNIYLKNSVLDEFGNTEEFYIHQDYTSLKYHVVADVPMVKVNEKNEQEGIKDVTFRLYGKSAYSTDVDMYEITDKDGYLVFKDVEVGTYILQEYDVSDDWIADHTEHRVEVNYDQTVTIDGNIVNKGNKYVVKNTPRIHVNISFVKKNLKNKLYLEGAKFKLYGTSKYGNECLKFDVSDEYGKVKFDDIEYGEYDLEEVKAPDGFTKGIDKYKVVVDENGNYSVNKIIMENNQVKFESLYEKGLYVIYNEPLHDFRIIKKDSYNFKSIPGVKFKLIGTSDYGTSYNFENDTDDFGFINYKGLEPGNYIIQEIFVPEVEEENGDKVSYRLDDTKYIVKIDKLGNVEIENVEKNVNGDFIFYNDREKGQITITKKWIDDNDKRDEPNIHISTKSPVKTVVYWRDARSVLNSSNNPSFSFYYNYSYGPLNYLDEKYPDKILGNFSRSFCLENEIPSNAKRMDSQFNDENAEYKIWAWIDEDGNLKWWSNADYTVLTNKSKNLFTRLNNVKNIDITDIDFSEITDASYMFFRCYSLSALDLSKMNTSQMIDMRNMFESCGFTKVDVSSFNTSRVTNMGSMFSSCNKLTELDLNNFDTKNVTNMSSMFSSCSVLKNVNVSSFNTEKVTNMGSMFSYCYALASLDVTSFDTRNVTYMGYTFNGCYELRSLDVSNFNTENVTSMYGMFGACKKIRQLDVSNFNTQNVESIESMFGSCYYLESIDLSNFDTRKMTNMRELFGDCMALQSINISNFDTSNVVRMDGMFRFCSKITSLDLSHFNTDKVTNMRSLFSSCYKLEELNISSFNTSLVTDMSAMFYGCSLKSLDLSHFDTKNVTSISQMFDNCSKLEYLNISNFDTSKITSLYKLFNYCSKLTSLDLSSFNTSQVTSMQETFSNCSSLTELDISNFDTSRVTNMSKIFYGCSSLEKLNIENLNTSKITNMSYMFSGLKALKSLNLNNINTSQVTDMSYMFYNSSGLVELYVDDWDTSKVTTMKYMFSGCAGFETFDFSKIKASQVTDMSYMFSECTGLKSFKFQNSTVGNVENMSYMFNKCSSLEEFEIGNIEINKVTNMSYMFSECTGLSTFDFSKLNASQVTNMSYMFNRCTGFESFYLENATTSNLENMGNMFNSCTNLKSFTVGNIETSKLMNVEYMFYNCRGLVDVDVRKFDVRKFDVSNVENMQYMFFNCTSLVELDLSSFNTSKVTNIYYMFRQDSSLRILDISNFDTRNVVNMSEIFAHCGKLETIYAKDFDISQCSGKNSSMFYGCYKLVGENGTVFNGGKTSGVYARIDRDETPGYFTQKPTSTSLLTNKIFNVIDNYAKDLFVKDIKISAYHIENPRNYLAENEVDSILTYSTNEDNYDDRGQKIEWKKNGDTWTYTFLVEDPNATWYVWEDVMEGYESNCTSQYPIIVENKNVVVINKKEEQPNISLNHIPTVKYSNLEISNKIMGVYEDSIQELTDDKTGFVFNVKLTAPDEYSDYFNGVKIIGDYVFVDGVAKITISGGEKISLLEIPEGTTFVVTEENNPKYKVEGYDNFEEQSGILQNEIESVNAINYIDKRPGSMIVEEEKTTNLKIKKVVIDDEDMNKVYNFELVLDNLKANTKYSLSNGIEYESDDLGAAVVSFELKSNEVVSVQNIPIGAKYKVYEAAGDYVLSYIIKDENDLGLIKNNMKNNIKDNLSIVTETETADEDESIIIEFSHKAVYTEDLRVRKIVTDENDSNSYMFRIEFSGLNPSAVINSNLGKLVAESDGTIDITLDLYNNSIAEFYKVPVGTKYKVTELASNTIASYKLLDENGVENFVNVSNANNTNKTKLSTEWEVIDKGELVTVEFSNDIVTQEEDKISTSIGVIKEVLLKDKNIYEDCDDEFRFVLESTNENNPLPENTEVIIKGNGEDSFGMIEFDKVGTYSYNIREINDEKENYIYDDTLYTITYEVTNLEGLLELNKTVYKNGFIGDLIGFVNVYDKTSEDLNPVIPEEPKEENKPEIPSEEKNDNVVSKPSDEKVETKPNNIKPEIKPDNLKEEKRDEISNNIGNNIVENTFVEENVVDKEVIKDNVSEIQKMVDNVKTGDNIFIYIIIVNIAVVTTFIIEGLKRRSK